MVGFEAVADPDEPFAYRDGEIAEAAWFTRDEVRAALQAGDWSSQSDSRLLLPGTISIARENYRVLGLQRCRRGWGRLSHSLSSERDRSLSSERDDVE